MPYEKFSETLLEDLKYLKKGKGFTPLRVMTAGNLALLIGGKNLGYETIRLRFISAINTLIDKESANLLRATFGLDKDYENFESLKQRRKKFSREVAHVGDDTLAKREDYALEDLVSILLNNYADVNLVSRVSKPERTRYIKSRRVDLVLENGCFISRTHEVEMVSLIAPVSRKPESYGFTNSMQSIIKPLFGIREVESYTTTSYDNKKGSKHFLTFDKLLKRNEPFRFSYEELPKTQTLGKHTKIPTNNLTHFEAINVVLPTRKAIISVEFRETVPTSVWWFKNRTGGDSLYYPDESALLEVNDNHTVIIEMEELYAGLRSGIAWKW